MMDLPNFLAPCPPFEGHSIDLTQGVRSSPVNFDVSFWCECGERIAVNGDAMFSANPWDAVHAAYDEHYYKKFSEFRFAHKWGIK